MANLCVVSSFRDADCLIAIVRSALEPTLFMWDAQPALAVVSVEYSRAVANGRLFGFVETGAEPVPYAVLSLVAEAVAVLAAGCGRYAPRGGW
jgi:hypothetical protein